eukprot:scaffold1_cov402-Prasinococcus_capsulatus_cf.AAC.13
MHFPRAPSTLALCERDFRKNHEMPSRRKQIGGLLRSWQRETLELAHEDVLPRPSAGKVRRSRESVSVSFSLVSSGNSTGWPTQASW